MLCNNMMEPIGISMSLFLYVSFAVEEYFVMAFGF